MIAPSFVHPEWLEELASAWLALAFAVALARIVARRRTVRLLGGAPARPAGRRRDRVRLRTAGWRSDGVRLRTAGWRSDGVRLRTAGWRSDGVLLLTILAIGLALLGPRVGQREQRIPASGVDVVVLLDVSRSMDARDIPPSRLDRARRTAAELLAGLAPGDRAALAVFGSRGVLLTPLTHDPDALLELLPALDTDLVQPAGSRLGRGVREALTAFDPASERARVLVVLSDGEDPDATGDLGRAEVMRSVARVVSVAFGSEGGATIPNQGLELRDRRGRVVLTRRDTGPLGALAEATDGALITADARFGNVDAASLLSTVRRDAARAGASPDALVSRRVPAVRVVPLALLAIVLLVGETLAMRWRKGRPAARAAAAAALVAVFSIAAHADSPDTAALFVRGAALAEIEDWPAAERAFRAAALSERDPQRAADAYHDAGVAALRGGRLEAARDTFLEAVALAPERRDSRFNLEWTLRALSAEDPPPPPSRQPEGTEASDAPRPEPDPARSGDPLPPIPEQPRPKADPRSGTARAPSMPPPLDASEVERLLSQTKDDPTRALRGLEGGDARERISPW